MKKLLISLLACLLIVAPFAFASAQDVLTIKGKVTDEEGNPLPGANVMIRDYNLGGATNVAGNYSFKVPSKFLRGQEVSLSVEYIGYHTTTKSIELSAGSETINFQLTADVLQMDEVVVTGVTERTPKKLLPFSVDRVTEQEIQMVPQKNPVQSLQGKVSGFEAVQGSGKPGTGIDTRIRGSTNIGGGNSPLFVVDGVILEASQVDIDALDVESIEVVKGAAAASLYGSRAANGVINIKTRRGEHLAVGETRIRFRSEAGFSQFVGGEYRSEHHEFKLTDDGEHFADADGNPITGTPREQYLNTVLDGPNSLQVFQDNTWPVPTYDHVEQFFNPGQFMRNRVEISRRQPGNNMLLSFGNLQEPGIIEGVEGYKRNNVRLNYDQKMTEDLDLGLSLYYMDSWRDDPEGSEDPFYSLMFMAPMANLEWDNPDGTPYHIQADPRSQEENPLYASHNQELEYTRKRLNANFYANWSPFTWFNLDARVSFDRLNRFDTEYYFNGFKSVDMQNYPTGHIEHQHRINEALNTDVTAKFYKNFGGLNTKNTFRYHYENEDYDRTYADGDNLAVNGVKSLRVVDSGEDEVWSYSSIVRAVGYYWESAMNYKEKYLGNFMLRYDGSSLFGEDERYQLYYRAGLGWRLSQEPWWFSSDINEFKLRVAYGTAGNRPGFSAQYETLDVSGGTISKETLGNKELRPAFSEELEIGLEMGLFRRLSLEATYSMRNTTDQILNVPLPAFYGYTQRTRNAGTLKANTFDATLNASIIQQRDMRWDLGLTFASTHEEITKLDAPAWRSGAWGAFYMREGETHGIMYGYRWLESADDLNDLANADNASYDAGAFQENDEGYLVPVGDHSWKDGAGADGKLNTDDDLWGTKVQIGTDQNGDPIEANWGMPVKYGKLDEKGEKTEFVQIGDVLPDFTTNLRSNFQWKGLTVYALFSAVIGGDIYNGTRQWAYRELRHVNVDQYGKPVGEKKPIGYYSKLYDTNKTNKEFVEDGTYLKLREVTVKYRFNRNTLLNNFGFLGNVFKGISVGVIGRNLFTITDYSGFDPEVGSVEYRVDNFQYPHFKQYTGFIEFEL